MNTSSKRLVNSELLVINLKTYKEGTGINALKIAKMCEQIQKNTKIKLIIAAQPTDILLLTTKTKIPIIAQHIDPINYGSNTGSILPESVIEAGAIGTLINHSEKRLNSSIIINTIQLCKQKNLLSVLCVKDEKEAKKYAEYHPDLIAIEPPELIGGKISISTAEPELITKTLRTVGKIPLLCGAGVHTREDVHHAYKLGAKGILVASGVVKAKNVKKEIEQLILGFKKLSK
ncbi:triose-phosphate isomerase [Candidatus Woesearchaeota archaeon CG10_big_fil_rev_8_21_14_0_10_32_9]|nr:MAG: triose-phosphate isomerase [Candidatus Woesearchaeota archaeon CG10_big_fil_rev_8_21_14_0_10_32_9]